MNWSDGAQKSAKNGGEYIWIVKMETNQNIHLVKVFYNTVERKTKIYPRPTVLKVFGFRTPLQQKFLFMWVLLIDVYCI